MSIYRIYGLVLRYLFLFRHSFDRLTDSFYWPTIDIALWGLTSTYLKNTIGGESNIVIIIISGLIFWWIIWRSQYEITVNILEDLWDKNFINVFVAPVKFSEWVISFLILGVLKSMISLFFMAGVAFLLYRLNIFSFGFYLIPFVLLLMMSGWWVGFIVAGIILRYGTKIQTLAWSLVAVFGPFSGIFYPISVLPEWAQSISSTIPMSYVFEGMREIVQKGTISVDKLIMAFILNTIYLTITLFFLKKSFRKRLKKGLINLS